MEPGVRRRSRRRQQPEVGGEATFAALMTRLCADTLAVPSLRLRLAQPRMSMTTVRLLGGTMENALSRSSDPGRGARTWRLLLALLSALTLVVSACGSDADSAEDQTAEIESEADDTATDATGDEAAADETGAEAGESTDAESAETDDAMADDEGEDGPAEEESAMVGELTDYSTVGELSEAELTDTSDLSSRFEGELVMTGPAGSDIEGPVSMTFSGARNPADGSADVSIDLGAFMSALAQAGGSSASEMAMMESFFEEPMRTITIGDTSWIQWSMITMFAGGDGTEWVEIPAEDSADMAGGVDSGSLGNPTDSLAEYREAPAEISLVGTETVRGVEADHYIIEIQVREWYDSLSSAEQAELNEKIDLSNYDSDVLPIEVWIDDNGYAVRTKAAVPGGDMFEGGSPEFESIVVTTDAFDFGADDLEIAPPAADEILDMGGMMQGAGG